LGGRCFKSNEEVKKAVQQWLNVQATKVYGNGIQKLITRYDKYLNFCGD